MQYVIDCSYSSALFLPDENSEDVRDFFLHTRKKNDAIVVPSLWWFETCNVLNSSIKRKRISYSDAQSILELFDTLTFQTDTEHGIGISRTLLELSRLCGISSYDAAYLELSMRKKATLLTLDNDLKKAAVDMGIQQ